MLSVLPPFLVAGVIAVLYFLGGKGTSPAGVAMKRDINFYFVAIVVTAIVSIIGGWNLDKNWVDHAAWVVAAIAVIACIIRFKSSPATNSSGLAEPERGPLERASDRDR